MKQIIIGLLLLVLSALAQTDGTWTTNAEVTNLTQGKVVKFTFALDSVGTLNSNSWEVSEFDDYLWATETIQASYKLTSANGSPKITAVIQGSMDNTNFAVIDTLFSAITGEAQAFCNTDMNSIHAPYLRLQLVGVAAGRADQTGWIHIYHYQARDEY